MFYPNNQPNYYNMIPQEYNYNMPENVYGRGGNVI